MRGHIRKRGETWSIFWEGPRKADGSRNKKGKGGFRTRREAQRALIKILDSLNQGSYVEPTKATLGEFLTQKWLPAARMSRRTSTLVGYEVMIHGHLVPHLGGVPLQRLTAADLNALYAELLASGRRDGKGGLSARSVRIVHTIVRRALADAVKWGLLLNNVADAADPPSAEQARTDAERRRAVWSAEELARFLAHVRGHRLYAAFLLAATTGMRRGEILGLRWRDLDLENAEGARLSVVQTLVAPRYELEFSAPKTRQGRRVIDLDGETVAALKEHRKRQLEERLAFGPDYEDTGLVFAREDGSPLKPLLFSYAFNMVVKKAKLPKIRLHDLRHTHASLLARSGVPPKVVQERLGHHSAGFTLDFYTHAFPADQREAARTFAALVHESPSVGSP